ncbi:redoxin domain-containing protein [Pusillimonas sp. TS35]|nr:TlpA disulfide reductase family protein [Paracandidimonas lactea]MYN14082.1 redoxin domain-containing protein [Pusillimonas sp. TS35]
MNRRHFLQHSAAAAAVLIVPATGLMVASRPARAAAPHPFYGRAFANLADKQVPITEYLGKPLVLNFWATWCPPCVKEMPDLDTLHSKYPGVNIVGLAVDTAANVRKFGDKVQVSYPLLIAGHGGIAIMRELGNSKGGLPFTVVFDAQGQPAKEYLGQVKPEVLDALLAGMV